MEVFRPVYKIMDMSKFDKTSKVSTEICNGFIYLECFSFHNFYKKTMKMAVVVSEEIQN